MVDAPIGGASHDDLLPSDHEEEPLTELVTRERLWGSNRRLAWLDSPFMEDAGVDSSIQSLHKRRNVDLLLAESNIVVDILDDDPSKLPEGMSKEATKQPHEPKDDATLREGGGC